jgi:hypothetical protein
MSSGVEQILGVVPWMVVSGVATWIFQGLAYQRGVKKDELDHHATVDVSRDDLAIELLSSARAEVVTARAEMGSLRDEINSLRAMEEHFFHFQQSLDHLSAVLFAKNPREKATAERHARAFLTRMVRLRDAKGTIANEAQRVDSGLRETEKTIRKEGGQV